jgi:hypothetical protein
MLSGMAMLLLVAYLFYGMIVPQTASRMARPSAWLIPELAWWAWVVSLPLPVPATPLRLASCLIGVALGACTVYGLSVYLSWKRAWSLGSLTVVGGAALVFFLSTSMALPNASTDIFNYIVNGRVTAVYHQNPYYVPAAMFPDDPLYLYASPKQTHFPADAKLPVWTGMSIFLAWLAGDDPTTNLLLYRGVFLGFNLLNLTLIAVLLRKLAPSFLLTGMIIYAWNPIVAVYGQSKTDTVMVFFLLLAILLLVTAHRRSAMVVLGLSVLVKLLTLPLVAVYWLRELRLRQWRELAISVFLLGLTFVVTYTVFWKGDQLLTDHLMLIQAGGMAAPRIVRPLVQIIFVLMILGIGLTQRSGHAQLLRGWALVMVYFCLFLTKPGMPWYLLTLIALVSLVPEWRIVTIMVMLSCISLLFGSWYTASSRVFSLPNLFSLPSFFVYATLPLLTALGLAGFTLWKNTSRSHTKGYLGT